MPSAPKSVQDGVDDEDLEREAGRCRPRRGTTTAAVRLVIAEAEQHERDQPGADHPPLEQHCRVHRSGAGDDDRGDADSRARARALVPSTSGASTNHAATIRRLDVAARADKMCVCRYRSRAPAEQHRRADAEELRQADGALARDPSAG